MSTEQSTYRAQNSVRRTGIIVSILAVVLLAHPLYLWPQLGSDQSAMLLAGFVRPLLTLLGGVLFTYGGLAAYRDEWRPVTPSTAVLFPVTASIAVLALQWYDQAVLGLVGIQPLNNNPVLVGALSLIFLVGGSLVRQGRRRAVAVFVFGCLALFLLGVVLNHTRLPIALVSGVALGIASVVIGAIGYILTASPAPQATQ